jgi:hypothetical protein
MRLTVKTSRPTTEQQRNFRREKVELEVQVATTHFNVAVSLVRLVLAKTLTSYVEIEMS